MSWLWWPEANKIASGKLGAVHSATGTPPSAWRKIARTWGSLYFDNFMKISSCSVPRKFYLSIPLIPGGITVSEGGAQMERFWPRQMFVAD
jgi:hypothetical protein